MRFSRIIFSTILAVSAATGLVAQQVGGYEQHGERRSGYGHHVHGQVTAVFPTYFTIHDEHGQGYNVGFSSSTRFFRGEERDSQPVGSTGAEVKIGSWIGAHGQVDEERHTVLAEAIHISDHAPERGHQFQRQPR